MSIVSAVVATMIKLMEYAESINNTSTRYAVTNRIHFDEESTQFTGMIKVIDTTEKVASVFISNDGFVHLYQTSEAQCQAMSLSEFSDDEIESITSKEEATALLTKMIATLEKAGVSFEGHPIDYAAVANNPEFPSSFRDSNTDGVLAARFSLDLSDGVRTNGKLIHCNSIQKIRCFKDIVCKSIACIDPDSAEGFENLIEKVIKTEISENPSRHNSKRLMFDFMFDALESNESSQDEPYRFNDYDDQAYSFTDSSNELKVVVAQHCEYATLFVLKGSDIYTYKYSTSGDYIFNVELPKLLQNGLNASDFRDLARTYTQHNNVSIASNDWLTWEQIKSDVTSSNPVLWVTKNGELGDKGYHVELFSMRDAEYLCQSLVRNKVLLRPLIINPDNLNIESVEVWIKDKQNKFGLNRANALILALNGVGEPAWIDGSMYSLGVINDLTPEPTAPKRKYKEDWLMPFQFCVNLHMNELLSSAIPEDINDDWWTAHWELLSCLIKTYDYRKDQLIQREIPDSDPCKFLIDILLECTDADKLLTKVKRGINKLSKHLSKTSTKLSLPIPNDFIHLKGFSL